jgi:hypothetical protein
MRRAAAVACAALLAVAAGTGIAFAAFTAHRSTPQGLTAAGSFGPPSGPDLAVQSRTNDGGAAGDRVQLGLLLTSTGGAQADLKQVEVRYWFTNDGSAGAPTAACYQADPGCKKITLVTTPLDEPRENADYYLSVDFPNGKLKPGASISLDQLAILAPAGATYRQDNDASFLDRDSFTDNPRVTAYLAGVLVWGTEP